MKACHHSPAMGRRRELRDIAAGVAVRAETAQVVPDTSNRVRRSYTVHADPAPTAKPPKKPWPPVLPGQMQWHPRHSLRSSAAVPNPQAEVSIVPPKWARRLGSTRCDQPRKPATMSAPAHAHWTRAANATRLSCQISGWRARDSATDAPPTPRS